MSKCLPGGDLVLLAAAVAIAISAELSADDTGVLANVFNAIGDNLAIISDKKGRDKDEKNNNSMPLY